MASDIFFSTNPADYLALEGLYVNELEPPGFIQGVDLFRVGMAGTTVRGPSTPQTITSKEQFLQIYGGRDFGGSGEPIRSEIWRALLNKPFGIMVIRRVVFGGATAGQVDLDDGGLPTLIINVAASSPGAWSLATNGGPTVSVEDASNGDVNAFNLRIKFQGSETLYENLLTTVGNDNLLTVVGDDPSNLVEITKLADGRPANIADQPLAGGSDGTAVAADYNSAITDLANEPSVSIVTLAGASVNQNALNGTIATLAASAVDRMFVTWAGSHLAVAADITARETDFPTDNDRVIWCFNGPYTLDPASGLQVQGGAHEWMASILSQVDVDINPGEASTRNQTAGIRKLTNEQLSRGDLILLKDAGIAAMEKLPDGGFQFRSGIVIDRTTGKTQITRRRSADFLILSAANRLRFFVKKKDTPTVRNQIVGELTAFSDELKEQERIIEDFSVSPSGPLTNPQKGIREIVWTVSLIGHLLHLVLTTQIGVGVTVQEQ